MDGLSGAASIIAVVSIAVQLGDSIYKLSRLLKSVQDAPRELQLLAHDLDRLRQILDEVRLVADLQKGLEFAPAPSLNLLGAVQDCQSRFRSLEEYASKISSQIEEKGIRKALTPLKIPFQKDTLRKLQKEMRQSIDHLSALLVLNSTKIQLAHFGQAQKVSISSPSNQLSTVSTHGGPELSTKETIHGLVLSPKQHSSITTSYAWYRSSDTMTFGTLLQMFTYCITYSQFRLSQQRALGSHGKVHLKRYDWSIIIFFWFLNRYLEFQSQIYCGQVERRWKICPVDPHRRSPVWDLCATGDTQGILRLFSQGLSPYLKDGSGRSLLNVAFSNCHSELCRMLLQQGTSLCSYTYDDDDYYAEEPLSEIDLYSRDLESFWSVIQVLVHHENESEDAFAANTNGFVLYSGNRGFAIWHKEYAEWSNFGGTPALLNTIVDSLRKLSDNFLDPFHFYSCKARLEFCQSCLVQINLHDVHEEGLWLLEGLFMLQWPWQCNIWELEESSENLGREWSSVLKKCGIDEQTFVDDMLNMNGGKDVYLKPIDFGIRGIGQRRLRKGRYNPLALRWEWDPPPEKNQLHVLEEFARLCIMKGPDSWRTPEESPTPIWPFTFISIESAQQKYVRREIRKAEKSQRKVKHEMRRRKIPGAFPN